MRRILLSIGVIAGLSAVIAQSVQSQSEKPKQAPPAAPAADESKARPAADRSADEEAIRTNIAQFVKFYNAGDAKGLASLFTPDGEAWDKEGNEAEGREAIAKTFGAAFAETPKRQIEVFVESLKFIEAGMAVEVGTTKEIDEPNQPPEYDRYTVIHVKRDGKWQMALARDEEGQRPSAHDQLEPLAWLVGEWIDDAGSSVVRSTCRWSEDGNFLLQEFKLQLSGRNAMNVSQRIGWDPVAKCVRSWVFDSEGGYGESAWTRDGEEWIIKATGVRPDGKTASATNTLTPAGRDGYLWRSTDRIVGDERQPESQVKVVRKPPQPEKTTP
jgi:uncharacterized protein (TIGR02246 family)